MNNKDIILYMFMHGVGGFASRYWSDEIQSINFVVTSIEKNKVLVSMDCNMVNGDVLNIKKEEFEISGAKAMEDKDILEQINDMFLYIDSKRQ